jgi:hypothetical protein
LGFGDLEHFAFAVVCPTLDRRPLPKISSAKETWEFDDCRKTEPIIAKKPRKCAASALALTLKKDAAQEDTRIIIKSMA